MSTAVTTVTGNITAAPELKYTKAGVARLPFSIASTSSYKDNDGEWKDETSFFNAVAWRGIAETAAETLEKGLAVIVTGIMEQRSWETPEGDKRSTVELKVKSVGPNCIGITSVTRRQRGDKAASNSGVANAAPAAPAYDMDDEPF
jgi:single-strand DNA-binding protein